MSDPEIKTTDEWVNGDIFPEEDELAAAPATDAHPDKYGDPD